MKVLAIDTSSASGSVALVEGRDIIAEINAPAPGPHAGWLMGAVASLMAEAGSRIDEVELFAVGVGPGSFTGLRIGVSTVKALAWSLGRPVAPVSTLEAMALNLKGSGISVAPVLDARKKEIYCALYRMVDGLPEPIITEGARSPEAFLEEVRAGGLESVVFLGSGLEVYRSTIESGFTGAVVASESDWAARAVNISELAHRTKACRLTAAELLPVYRRRSEAELNSGR